MNETNAKPLKTELSTEPYKGVRDFYPEDMFVLNYIFKTMRSAVESFGYSEYNASILEPTELYKAKTSEEIVNEQTYSFKDRGDRDVTLRPEMTPTVARMIAGRRREIPFPARWYSIPNVFRYERPQRGRLREHFQLNVDLFGSKAIEADVEIISAAHSIMKAFGAQTADFKICINNRKLMNAFFGSFGLDQEKITEATRLVDRKKKMTSEEFLAKATDILGKKAQSFIDAITSATLEAFPEEFQTTDGYVELLSTIDTLKAQDIPVFFDPTIMRGFDYYTGTVFEVFDTNPENKRSLFGGGRYDNLTANFGGEAIPAVGFGMGDVTIRDFLETHNLLPLYKSSAQLFIATIGFGNNEDEVKEFTQKLSTDLRISGVNTIVNITDKKVGDQLKYADKLKIPFVVTIGEDEMKQKQFKVKELASGTETECSNAVEIVNVINSKSNLD